MLSLLIYFLSMILLTYFYKNWWFIYNFVMIGCILIMVKMNLFLELSCQSVLFGLDSISYWLMLLSVWISGLMIMASWNIFHKKLFSEFFLIIILSLLITLMLCFTSLNFLLFYIFFEGSLIPTLLLILGWGYQPERSQAGIYMMFYTLLASLPLLIMIIMISGSNEYLFSPLMSGGKMNEFMYLLLVLAFLVKLPMYMVHLWLPKAHVEAPIAGSMILAGILLKLGGYGLMRVMVFVPMASILMNKYFLIFSLAGGAVVSLLCMRQVDMKSLIAYSSVAHMSLVIGGVMTLSHWGMMGSLILMIGHGLCSSGLFCLANVSYERFQSRSMLINKGGMLLMPTLGLWWFLLSSSNMAAPISLNLLGEISILNSLLGFYSGSMILLMLLSFFSAAYSLYLFSFSQHGYNFSGVLSSWVVSFREYQLFMFHWIPLNFIIFKGDIMCLY